MRFIKKKIQFDSSTGDKDHNKAAASQWWPTDIEKNRLS